MQEEISIFFLNRKYSQIEERKIISQKFFVSPHQIPQNSSIRFLSRAGSRKEFQRNISTISSNPAGG